MLLKSVPLKQRYRIENEIYCIDCHLQSPQQLFDSRDPAPFRDKDLDEDFVRYLTLSLREISIKNNVKLVMLFPESVRQNVDQESITRAIHNFFEFEVEASRNEMSSLFRQGRVSLLIGLNFLLFFSLISWLNQYISNEFWRVFVKESFNLLGWVSMWKPIQIYLYDWWPIHDRILFYRKLSQIEVQFTYI